jgi:uncharacterized protein (TIGR02246 family)
MSFTGPLEDRVAIRELIEHYADAVTRRDADDWSQVWAEDAVWCLPDYPGMERFEGRAAIVDGWKKSMADFPGISYLAVPGAINVSGNRATARTFTDEVFPMPGRAALRQRGRYDDELAKIDGAWKFTRRIYSTVRAD